MMATTKYSSHSKGASMRIKALTLLIVGLLLIPNISSAENATPAAPPAELCGTVPVCSLPGFGVAVGRFFNTVMESGSPLTTLRFEVIEFNSVDDAANGMTKLIPLQLAPGAFLPDWDFSSLKPTAVHNLGDNAIAYAGVAAVPSPVKPPLVALIAAQSGRFVYFALGVCTGTPAVTLASPLGVLADVLASTMGRPVSPDPVTMDSAGMKKGGMWSLLPSLSDMPEGFQFIRDVG
jgi:hypothetical protein